MASDSANFSAPSFVTLPSSTLARRFVPSDPMMRRRSATGLKSTVAEVPAARVVSSFDFAVAVPVWGSMVTTVPSAATP